MKAVADTIRWTLILGIWGYVSFILWGVAWGWTLLWVVPGFFLLLNLVGFATLPIYFLITLVSPEDRAERESMRRLNERMNEDPPHDP